MNASYLTQGLTIIILGGLICSMWHSVHTRLNTIELRLVFDAQKRQGDYNNPHKIPDH